MAGSPCGCFEGNNGGTCTCLPEKTGPGYGQPVSPFRAHTGLMGATDPGQIVTAGNIHFLPPGSSVRTKDREWLIHLHDGLWLRIFDCGYCYDRAERFHCLLPGTLAHHP